jgi:hypothetical protein
VKFFLDHDVPAEVGRVLRQVNHEVIELRQVLPPHTSNFEALARLGWSNQFPAFIADLLESCR